MAESVNPLRRRVRDLLARLNVTASPVADVARAAAAAALYRLAVHERGTIAPRGTLREAANYKSTTSSLESLSGDVMHDVATALSAVVESGDATVELRANAAQALGEWGDATAVEVLKKLVDDASADLRIRRAAWEALGTIGGQDAAATLARVVAASDGGDDDVFDALAALSDLANATDAPPGGKGDTVRGEKSGLLATLEGVQHRLNQKPHLVKFAKDVLERASIVGI